MPEDDSDLSLTVRELSNAYEELSLLYRISEVFSFLSVEDICTRISDEAVSTLGVRTAAVLFLDDNGETLRVKTAVGNWNRDRVIRRNSNPVWKAIESKRSAAFCKLAETVYADDFPEVSSLMVCPIIGKVKEIGAIVVGDKDSGEEFYSNDLKLLAAIAAQAGLAIENAFLYEELESLLLGAIRSLVKALEATSYWTAGHTERVTEYTMGIAGVMGMGKEMLEKLRICSLLHDIGKIATPKEILNKKGGLEVGEWDEIKRHPGLGAEILTELRQFSEIILSIKYHHEHWDGLGGIYGLKHEQIPLMARILAVADAFDAMTSDRPYRKMKSKEEAINEIVKCSGTQFDPTVVAVFLKWVKNFTLPRRVSVF
jgi:putative nucleotidyltransferase with HDIG domain